MDRYKFAALAVVATVFVFASSASAAPPRLAVAKDEINGGMQLVHGRPYRHCHWSYGRRWCHGGYARYWGPSIGLYWGPAWRWGGWGHHHGHHGHHGHGKHRR